MFLLRFQILCLIDFFYVYLPIVQTTEMKLPVPRTLNLWGSTVSENYTDFKKIKLLGLRLSNFFHVQLNWARNFNCS